MVICIAGMEDRLPSLVLLPHHEPASEYGANVSPERFWIMKAQGFIVLYHWSWQWL